MAIKLVFYKPIIGMDVEFFLKRGRSIVGSERILDGNKSIKSDRGSFVKDGVQIEINPVASYCREILGTSIAKCFQTFRDYLSDHSGITPCFDECVTVPSREFKTLSADSKRFGCDPDYNAHEGGKENIKVRGDSTRVRTAGGHIHFGSSSNEVNFKITGEKNEMLIKCKYCIKDCKEYKEDNFHSFPSVGKGGVNFWDIVNFNSLSKEKKIVVLNKSNMPKSKIESNVDKEFIFNFSSDYKTIMNYTNLIPMFDLLCGIPSVLIDRDPNVANRRKQYGRAGDYRYQPHGIEYRTLSNFWIKDFKLMHLFTGLARTAFLICSSDTNQGTHIMKDLWKLVDQKDVIDAINNSDYKLARDIWLKIESYIVAIGDNDQTHYPISSATIRGFKQFIIDGVKKHTNNDPIKHWVGTLSSSRTAWETYASRMNVHSDIDNIFKNTIKE